MRLGFVGVGRWAQKLKVAFEAEGAEVVAYTRATRGNEEVPRIPGWGQYVVTARDMIPMIQNGTLKCDAVVLCAPPSATTDTAINCAVSGIPVMATKPLMLEKSVPIRAPFYVDYFRLWSDAFKAFNGPPHGHCSQYTVQLCGSGPVRSFPGLLDYGPHVLAYLRKIFGENLRIGYARANAVPHRASRDHGEMFEFGGTSCAGSSWRALAGNGLAESMGIYDRWVSKGNGVGDVDGLKWSATIVEDPEYLTFEGPIGYATNGNEPNPKTKLKEPKSDVIRRMCRSFLNDISEGFVTTEHIDLSCAVMRDLAEVRRLADQSTGVSAGHGARGEPATELHVSPMKQPAGSPTNEVGR